MTDFTAAGALHAAGFTRGIGRHVVVMDIALEILIAQTVQGLTFADGAQGSHGQGLGLAAGEDGTAVGTGKNTDIAPDGADFVYLPAVGTNAFVQDFGAHDFLVQIVQSVSDFIFPLRETLRQGGNSFFLCLRLTSLTFFPLKGFKCPDALVVGIFTDGGLDIIAGGDQRDNSLFLADFGNNLLLEGNQLFDLLMREENRVQNGFLRELLRAGFHHHDGFFGSSNIETQIAFFALLLIGADDELTVHTADQHCAGGAVPRDITDGQSDGRADHGGDFRGNILLHAQHGDNHLDIIPHTLVEEGTERTVDQTACQGRLFGGAAFTLDESAGNFADGILLFFDVHSEREEVHSFTGSGSHRGIDHYDGISQVDPHGAVCLFTVSAEFQRQRTACEIHGKFLRFHTFHSF